MSREKITWENLESIDVRFSVHTVELLKEIQNNPGTGILKRPLQIFANLLHDMAEVASRINDPELNYFMVMLTLYAVADPYDKENYDKKAVEKIEREYRKFKKSQSAKIK